MVLKESCLDEKQKKHNSKRLVTKQGQLDTVLSKKGELEREIEGLKNKKQGRFVCCFGVAIEGCGAQGRIPVRGKRRGGGTNMSSSNTLICFPVFTRLFISGS